LVVEVLEVAAAVAAAAAAAAVVVVVVVVVVVHTFKLIYQSIRGLCMEQLNLTAMRHRKRSREHVQLCSRFTVSIQSSPMGHH